jgi:replicative DNA helicase
MSSAIRSEEAEMAVLGSMMLSAEAASVGVQELKPADFYRPAHQLIFGAMRLLVETGQEVDLVTVRSELDKDLERAGGLAYLVTISEYVPSPANIGSYAAIVRDKASRRRVVEGAGKLASLARADASLDEIRALMDGLLEGSLSDGPMLVPLRDIRPAGKRKGISTGFARLDSVNSCSGYPCGQITTVCAYHKTGKSTWMLQSAVAAARAGHRVLYMTVADLSRDDVMRKVLRMLCGWEIEPSFEPHKSAYFGALYEVESWDFSVYDASDLDAGSDVETIAAVLRTEHAKKPLGLVCIDYAQELTSSDRKAVSEYAEQTICAKKLRIAAARMKTTATLVGSQITEGGKDGRDRTKSTRAWEEKPGWILRLRRDEYGDVLRVQSAFSRFGGTGYEMELHWDPRGECYVS